MKDTNLSAEFNEFEQTQTDSLQNEMDEAIESSVVLEPSNSAKVTHVEEIHSMRDETRKVFLNSDGSKQAVFYASPVHSFNDDEHRFVECNVIPEEDADGRFLECKNGRFNAKFSRDEVSDELFTVEKGEHRLTVYAKRTSKQKQKALQSRKSDDKILFTAPMANTEYEYTVFGDRVKENIVIGKKKIIYQYPFSVETQNLKAVYSETEKTVSFLDAKDDTLVFTIPAPYMTDASGVQSTEVSYELKQSDADKLVLTVVADSEWMNSEDRTFPVVIDPQVLVSGSTRMNTYSINNGKLFEATQHTISSVFKESNLSAVGRMYLKVQMPTLPLNPRIKKAWLTIRQNNSFSVCDSNAKLGLYRLSETLQSGIQPIDTTDLFLDYARVQAGTDAEYRFDITALLDDALSSGKSEINLMLKLVNEVSDLCTLIYLCGATGGTKAPKLVIDYESGYEFNSSESGHNHELGRFGTGNIDLQRGNLTFESSDFAWGGNRMPVTIKHQYNSILSDHNFTKNTDIALKIADYSSMKLGQGWMLNLQQSMVAGTFLHDGITHSGYIYTDENCNETYFVEGKTSEFRKCKTTNTSGCVCTTCYYLYTDTSDSGYTYDATTRELVMGDQTYCFNESGRLICIRDAYKNEQMITYSSNRITSVTDGVGRVFAFAYNTSGFLTSITAPDGSKITYAYTNNLLTTITYPDNTKAVIAYSSNKPASVLLKDATGASCYKVAYTFSSDRVTAVKEYGFDGTTAVEGAETTYAYSAAARRTVLTTTEVEDANTIQTVYAFDDEGGIVSNYVYSVDTGRDAGKELGSGINPYAGEGGASIISNIHNYLLDHNFEKLDNWQKMPNNLEDFDCEVTTSENNAVYGRSALRIRSYQSEATENGIYQDINSLAAGSYTFSVYARNFSSLSGDVYLRVCKADGTIIGESEHLKTYSSEFMRLILPFELTAQTSIRVYILVNGYSMVYTDAAQLENNAFANRYNMLINGGFEKSINTGWANANGAVIDSSTSFNHTHSLRIDGSLGVNHSICQQVNVKTARGTKETFTLSGWAKGYAIPDHEREGSPDAIFRLRAVVRYWDSFYNTCTSETYTADFSPCTEEWQYASVQFSKTQYRQISSVYVYCDYGYNVGSAYFDDIQLTRDSIETRLSASDFVAVSDGDMDDEDNVVEADSSPTFNEAKDKFGNVLTETTFTDGEFGTIYRAFGFDADGNNLLTEIDARGNATEYTVDDVTSRNKEVNDRCGNKTAYEYDAAGRTTKVTSKDANDKELANVSYSYDAFDNLTEIARGDGMKYSLAYNAFNELESIGVNGKSESLAKYTYKNGNGRLKAVAYANGDTVQMTYNSIGQLATEKWYNSSNALTAHYKYVYDGVGNLVRSLDILARKEYTYTYEDGKITRSAEYDITLSGEIVTGKTLVNAIQYTYDSEDKLTKKCIIPASGSQQTVYYENEDENTVVKFSAGGRTVTSHSKNDSFGRKVFDELQLGSGFVSRQFSYVAGEVTDEHKDNSKLKSSATTQLVSRIILSDGRTISYEYDAEERITKVIDSVDGTTEYTYDALGQLLTEKKDGVVVNTMTYDNYGNILSKNGKSYTYGDSVWKDKLTAYDGKSITYDAQGNPTSYLGHTLTWEKGRQLKSFDSNTYTYNANGIRTKKTVGGINHNYILEGSDILSETWEDNSLIPLYDNEGSICGVIFNDISYYFVKNIQGDVIAIADKDAKIVAKYSYDAWGASEIVFDISSSSIASVNPFRFKSYYYDEESKLYYLQSRYYDPHVGRFLNSDDINYLGMAGTILSHNLFTYCENDCVDFVDYFGHAPSLSTLTQMHNAVVQSAQSFLFSVGTITTSEVKTCNSKGKYNGRMDIYSYISNRVWEVKRNNSTGISAGLDQLGRYTSSYVYSLYHAWFRTRKTPRYGNKSVYGSIVVSNYLVTYCSYSGNKALIVYDYMSLERAAELLFSAVAATSAVFAAALARCAKKTREKVYAILGEVGKFLGNVGRASQKVLNAIGVFLKKAGPIILSIIAIIIFLCTGAYVPA